MQHPSMIGLGERLWQRRKALGLPGLTVANAASISYLQLRRLEKGNLSFPLHVYIAVAEALGWTIQVGKRRVRPLDKPGR